VSFLFLKRGIKTVKAVPLILTVLNEWLWKKKSEAELFSQVV